jgi:hypothetical protein
MNGENGVSRPIVLRASSGELVVIPYTGLAMRLYCLDDESCESFQIVGSTGVAHNTGNIEYDPDMETFIKGKLSEARRPIPREYPILYPLSPAAHETLAKVCEEEAAPFMELDGSDILLLKRYPKE